MVTSAPSKSRSNEISNWNSKMFRCYTTSWGRMQLLVKIIMLCLSHQRFSLLIFLLALALCKVNVPFAFTQFNYHMKSDLKHYHVSQTLPCLANIEYIIGQFALLAASGAN
jgi:hypothetical protein